MKKKIGAILCLMCVGLLLLPATSAIGISKAGEINDASTNISFVSSGIHLTKAKLPLLKKAVQNIDNPTVQQLLQEIIDVLSKKNIVTSIDIQHIIDAKVLFDYISKC